MWLKATKLDRAKAWWGRVWEQGNSGRLLFNTYPKNRLGLLSCLETFYSVPILPEWSLHSWAKHSLTPVPYGFQTLPCRCYIHHTRPPRSLKYPLSLEFCLPSPCSADNPLLILQGPAQTITLLSGFPSPVTLCPHLCTQSFIHTFTIPLTANSLQAVSSIFWFCVNHGSRHLKGG